MRQSIMSFMALSLVVFTMAACSEENNEKPEIPVDKTYSVGDFYNVDGVKGIVYQLSDDTKKHGMILSLDQKPAPWAIEAAAGVKTGAVDTGDGAKNAVAIMAIDGWATKYPAFAWCEAKNTGGVTGWFLPAFEQLIAVYNAYAKDPVAFNASLTKNGGMAIVTTEGSAYWSSSENLVAGRENEAGDVGFGGPYYGFGIKTEMFFVRAVRVF